MDLRVILVSFWVWLCDGRSKPGCSDQQGLALASEDTEVSALLLSCLSQVLNDPELYADSLSKEREKESEKCFLLELKKKYPGLLVSMH